jgi:hypothetical protein
LWDGPPLILFQITLHHNLPYCKLKGAYREREGSPAVRFKEPLYDNYVPPGVTVRQQLDQTKKSAQPAAAKGSNTARVNPFVPAHLSCETGQPLIIFQITLHHNLPYCKFKVQQIIKQSNKKRIYNLNNLFTLLESRNCSIWDVSFFSVFCAFLSTILK